MSVVGDGWANLMSSPALYGSVNAIAMQAKASPSTFDPNIGTARNLIEVLTLQCIRIGDTIQVKARTGQGG